MQCSDMKCPATDAHGHERPSDHVENVCSTKDVGDGKVEAQLEDNV